MNHAWLGRLTVSRLLKGASAIMATGLLAVGGFGLYTSIGLADDAQRLHDGARALSLSGRADMMHDAIRGDVAVLLLGTTPSTAGTGGPNAAPSNAPGAVTQAQAELQVHAKTLKDALAELKTLELDPALQARVADAETAVASYVLQAEQTLRRVAADPAGARSQFATFERSYEALEAPLGAISDALEQAAVGHKAEADRLRQSAIVWITASTGATILAVLLTCGWISGQIQRPLQHAVRSAEEVANGRLGTEVPVAGPQDTQRLLAALNHMNGRLHALVHGIRQDSEGVSVASAEIAQGGQDLSQRTERQSAALEEAASTMSELGHTVRRNAEQAHEAAELATQAQAVAGRSQAMTEQVVQTMQSIRDGSQRMVEIVSLIDSIAFQTNILALNAAVEAARAGEQGRGFAVVAGEVRTLATRSAEAAKEIRSLITGSLEQVQAGTQRAGETGQTMQELLGSVARVAGLISEIDLASRQQTSDIDGMVQVVNELDAMTQQNAALVEESAAAAHSLSDQAERLRQQVQGFELTGSGAALLVDDSPAAGLSRGADHGADRNTDRTADRAGARVPVGFSPRPALALQTR